MAWMPDPTAEWIETDGRGGYAMGTVCGRRMRRYHGLLVAATVPPTGRMMLVNGFDAWLEVDGQEIPISTQLYTPYVVAPDNSRWLEEFTTRPWPTWLFRLPDGSRVRQELFMPRGRTAAVLRWRRLEQGPGEPLRLHLRPFLSGRDHHSQHHENPSFQFAPQTSPCCWTWQAYPGLPPMVACSNGRFREQPLWYRNFIYEHERDRGLDDLEDLATPGVWTWNLSTSDAVLIWTTGMATLQDGGTNFDPIDLVQRWAGAESSRRAQLTPHQRHSETYIVHGRHRETIVAGYPWFTDWGRDTFISLRGLCLANGDLATAGAILDAWSGLVSEGMLPNRFPDAGAEPEFNSVDASLWYIVVVREYLDTCRERGLVLPEERVERLLGTVRAIIAGYAEGTRYRIHLDDDGLIAAGVPGVQLTWMDAKVGDWVVTPRIGKPVEIQALWLNALAAFPEAHPSAVEWLARGQQSFMERYWNETTGCLNDVVDVDHVRGQVDDSIRPNQLFAMGGLPTSLLSPGQTQRALQVVEEHLLTPLGMRTLSPSSPRYCGRYQGDVRSRDGAYHQGTVWPWLMGAFVLTWLKVRGDTPENRQLARQQFLAPLERHRREAGLDHISEIADADAPHTPRGCPFQAWSLGEYVRLDLQILRTER